MKSIKWSLGFGISAAVGIFTSMFLENGKLVLSFIAIFCLWAVLHMILDLKARKWTIQKFTTEIDRQYETASTTSQRIVITAIGPMLIVGAIFTILMLAAVIYQIFTI